MKIIDKKKIITFLTAITFCSVINAQTTIILQPDATQGKDAYIVGNRTSKKVTHTNGD